MDTFVKPNLEWTDWLVLCFVVVFAWILCFTFLFILYYLYRCLTRRHEPKEVEPLMTSEELLVIEAHLQLNAAATPTFPKLASAFISKREAHATKVVQLEVGIVNALLVVIGGLTKTLPKTDRFFQAVDFITEIVKVCAERNKQMLRALHAAKRTSNVAGVDESLLTSLVEMMATVLRPTSPDNPLGRRRLAVPPALLGASFTRLVATYLVNDSGEFSMPSVPLRDVSGSFVEKILWDIYLRNRLYATLMEVVTYCQKDVAFWDRLCENLKSREKLAFCDRLSVISLALESYVQNTKALIAANGTSDSDERMKQLAAVTRRLLATRPAVSVEPNDRHQNHQVVYKKEMQPFQFDCVPFFDRNGNITIPYAFTKSLRSIGGLDRRIRRLAQEVSALRVGLPLDENGSIFVRMSEERLDVLKVLIIGPVGTPYANGCFVFDVFMPPGYPNSPPRVQLMTTGNGTVRFNPNLYACGKVCLSLLNTWLGFPKERWSPSSSLLQVLVSIQSLILIEDPWFNEPGRGCMRGTANGQAASTNYNQEIQTQCAYWAILDVLNKPPTPFADVIRRHFWLKRYEILRDTEAWLRSTWANQRYKSSLETTSRSLKTEFSRMTKP